MRRLVVAVAVVALALGAVHVSAQDEQPDIVLHYVQSGDTLTGIAARYGTTVQTIRAANRRVDDPNRIFVGEVIFEDHNYTPDKDGEACRPRGELTGCRYSWHWDTIIVGG